MSDANSLEAALKRLLDGVASESDLQTLRQARVTLATGKESIALGGDITNSLVNIGGQVVEFKGVSLEAIREALSKVYPTRLFQLPADLADFTGREEEVAKLLVVLRGGEGKAAISALGGMGGVGKTALAVHVAHKLAPDFPDAQIMVNLLGTSKTPLRPVAAMGKVITAFHPEADLPINEDELIGFYRSILHGKRVLLIFDNAWNAAQVSPLLPPPHCGVLVSSRRTIVLPGVQYLNLDVLPEPQAVKLLSTIVGTERTGQEELQDLAGRCGYLPLALRVAGSYLAGHHDWTVAEYLKALADEKERLRRLKDDVGDVEATLGLSAAQLARENPGLAERWQMLAVFPASFDRSAVAAVWDVELNEAWEAMSELLVWSLVLFDPDKQRYRLHDLMRFVARNVFSYADEKLDELTKEASLYQAAYRHAKYYFKLLKPPDDLYSQDKDFPYRFLNLLYNESDNLYSGHTWALANLTEYEKMFVTLKDSLSEFLFNKEFKQFFRKYPEFHIEVLRTMAYMSQILELHKLKNIMESKVSPFNKISLALSLLEEKRDELPYFYPEMFEQLVVIWDKLLSIPYYRKLKDITLVPEKPIQRRVWQLMILGQRLMDDMVKQHKQIMEEHFSWNVPNT